VTKLLIDECPSAELALMARERGHQETSHVLWIGKSGWKDWEPKRLLLAEDWVLVTRNSDDFRDLVKRRARRGSIQIYRSMPV
jgi:predicted nuclease of predicted toxin-antitoxin system